MVHGNNDSNEQKLRMFVGGIYQRLGYRNITITPILEREADNRPMQLEFDVAYSTILRRRYIECIPRNGGPIPLNNVSGFVAKLELAGIPMVNGTVVSNGVYSPEAVEYARKHSIELIDKERLEKMFMISIRYGERVSYKKNPNLDEMIGHRN